MPLRMRQRSRRALFWSHRWLGIITCLLCAMWFASGLVMMYVPYPSWRDDERVQRLPAIDAASIAVAPGEALATLALPRTPTIFRLEMAGAEPVYRIYDFGRPFAVSAKDGRAITRVSADDAQPIVRALFPGTAVTFQSAIDIDQWTVTSRFNPHRPLHLFAVADGLGTQVYVSSKTGEVVQATTKRERFWNWLGSVPHWIYFTPIRADGAVWRQVIMWTAGPAAIGAMLGIWIGLLKVRFGRKRFTPYRGWMKWHHLTGLAGGVALMAWLGSGWLSVGPFDLFNSLPVTPDQLARFYTPDGRQPGVTMSQLKTVLPADAREVEFSWLAGEPLVIVNNGGAKRAYDAATGLAADLSVERITAAARPVLDGSAIAAVERLDHPDVYWYSHIAARPLPILRVRYDTPTGTWLTIDLTTGRVVGASDRSDRTYRWLFHLVHQYDLPVLLANPWWRYAIMWLLSLLGLIISISGAVIGLRSLRRS